MEVIQEVLQVAIWFLSVPLVVLILLQGGGDLSSTFGGGGQLDSTLGVGASAKMSKITGWMSFAFLVAVLIINYPTDARNFAASATTGAGEAAIEAPVEPAAPVEPSEPAAAAAPAAEVEAIPEEIEEAPAAEQPAAEQPAAEQPAAEQPAAAE